MDYMKLTELDLETEQRLLTEYRKELKNLPEQNMVCKTIRGHERYYLINRKEKKYISEANFPLVDDIKRQHFLKKLQQY